MALENNGPGWLFCPADRPERFEKAAAAADVVILDLEDGVAAKDREAAREALVASRLDPARTVVRINPSATADHQLDLDALSRTEYTAVMLAKTESPRQVRDLAPREVIVLIETPLGALDVGELARMENAFAVMWGAEDLCAESDDAVAVGFDAKVAIHPTQVAVIRAAYAPTDEQVDWARRVLDTARTQRGVFQYEGIMVDAPVLRRAERIVSLAPHPGS